MSEATPMFDAASPAQRVLPAELGRYVLLRELGSGGMANVYLGKMRLTGGVERLVALKTIHEHLADQPSFVDMFLDEAKIATQIVHPNVCVVHDFGSADGVYYLSMEYLVGEPLSAVIRRLWDCASDEEVAGAMPFLAARIIADACEGLHAAHETRRADGKRLQVVHRDVSPQNLFVTYDGSVKVVDFGCAKAIQRITETSAGIFKGKVAYAAPEQLKIQSLDARTDVWALGVCLWETLTLERLFKRDTPMATARAVLSAPVPRADEHAPWVPPELADVAARALMRDPMDRYQTAREMGRDLRLLIAGWGATFESAELAEWMEFFFEEQRRERLQVAEQAEATLASEIVPTPRELEPTMSEPGVDAGVDAGPTTEWPALRREPDPAPSAPPESGRPPTGSRPLLLAEEDLRDRPPERSSLWWAIPVSIVLVTAVTLLAIYVATRMH